MKTETEQKDNIGLALAALMCGIAGICICLMPYFGLPLGVIAIILSTTDDSKVAQSGLSLGIIATILNAILLLLLLTFG